MMSRGRSRWLCLGCILAGAAAAVLGVVMSAPALKADEPAADAALQRTREQVKMLDTLYKTAVVSVNNKYEINPPAIRVAEDIFAAMEKGGWHKAKLMDASGVPKDEDNLPKTPFEKRAAAAMQAGKPYYEEIEGSGGNRKLLAATIVPAVAKRCASCHGVKEGDLLGFIRYEVPIK